MIKANKNRNRSMNINRVVSFMYDKDTLLFLLLQIYEINMYKKLFLR